MTGLVEMMLLRAMSASAAREESRRRKRNNKARERAVTCAVCRDCRRKEKNHD